MRGPNGEARLRQYPSRDPHPSEDPSPLHLCPFPLEGGRLEPALVKTGDGGENLQPHVILTSAQRPPLVILNVAKRSEESIVPHAQPSSSPVILAHTSPHLLLPNSPHYAPISSMTCYHWSNFPKGYSQLHPQEPKRSLRQAFRNLLVSLPLPRKCRLFVTNNCTKIFGLSSCCGNHGEPGC